VRKGDFVWPTGLPVDDVVDYNSDKGETVTRPLIFCGESVMTTKEQDRNRLEARIDDQESDQVFGRLYQLWKKELGLAVADSNRESEGYEEFRERREPQTAK
jgi:hypothetical protein